MQTQGQTQLVKMMNEKWTIVFKLLDFNQDGVISSKDRDDCIQSFLSTYKPEGEKKKRMVADLNSSWDKMVFMTDDPNWNKALSLDDYLTTRKEAYTKDSARTVTVVREGLTQLIGAAVNTSEKFSFEEFKVLHEAFNIKDEKFIKVLYTLVGSDDGGSCSVSAIAEFYTELSMGNNEEKHRQYKTSFASVGFL